MTSLNFLTDHIITLSQDKIAIDSLFPGFSQRTGSHRGAWPKIIRDQILTALKEKAKCDVLYGPNRFLDYASAVVYDWGMEFKGALNFIGGLPKEFWATLDILRQRLEYQKVYSWGHDMPDVVGLLLKRNDVLDAPSLFDSNIAFLTELRGL